MFLDKVLTKSVKEAMSNAYVVKKCLELGYSTWVLSSNELLVDEGLLLERIRSEYDFYIGENSGVLIVKSSLVTQKLWSSIESSARKNQGVDCIHLVREVVEGKGKMVKTVETVSIGENTNANQSLGDGNRWCIGHLITLERKKELVAFSGDGMAMIHTELCEGLSYLIVKPRQANGTRFRSIAIICSLFVSLNGTHACLIVYASGVILIPI
ncbi:hypothetical protein YC2023_013920 [Brassica napus]